MNAYMNSCSKLSMIIMYLRVAQVTERAKTYYE